MFYAVAIIVAFLGQLTHGVPLEDPSANFSQFFDSRIVGGTEAPHGMVPHMMGLYVGWVWISFICGSSLITDQCMLTAAHCVTGFIQWDGELMQSFHGRVGSNILEKGIIVEFKGFRNHPEYDAWYVKNDVGVLFAKKKLLLNKDVAVIPLNLKCRDEILHCFVAGWGTDRLWGAIPDKLQYLRVSTITHKQCARGILEAAHIWGGIPPHVDPIGEICTFHSVGHGMCHGDSGSALICDGVLVGMVSWGLPCAIGGPDVHVNVCAYKRFIEESVAHGCCGHKEKEKLQIE